MLGSLVPSLNPWQLFLIAAGVEILYIGLFLLTLRRPVVRFWPPPRFLSWQFFSAWTLAAIVAFCFLALGWLDFDSFILPPLVDRGPLALACFILGTVIGGWASLTFGMLNLLGLGKSLVTAGPYRFTRNPQYLGDSLNITGFMILTNSWMVVVIGILGVLLNFLAPFLEEPWLEKRFGEPYLTYKEQVPRFLGLKSRERRQEQE